MKRIVVFLFLILLSVSDASEKKTICLNMIVKDEKDVIERCLNSAKPLIDYWVIFDTGSTDGTQDAIRECMKGIPGELHESPWVNFEHNRNEALEVAKKRGDYIMWIDADEVLLYDDDFEIPKLEKDFYHMIVRQLDAADARRCAVIRSDLDWKWVGVLHEVLHCDQARTHDLIRGVMNICNSATGARSKLPPEVKYMKDALVLEKALEKEPNNSRYMYYLGISYSAANELEKGLEAFKKRIEMPSNDWEETYQALYNIGSLQEKMGQYEIACESFIRAYQFRPIRREPLYRAAQAYRKSGNPFVGYLVAKHALTIPYPEGEACVQYQAYDYATDVEFANCALLSGFWQEGLEASKGLLNNPTLPEEHLPSIQSNYELAQSRLQPVQLRRAVN